MSIDLLDTTITGTKRVIERTWRAGQHTEFQTLDPAQIDLSKYKATVLREIVTVVEGLPPIISHDRIAPFVGEPAEGTDGSEPEHYTEAKPGFEPAIYTDMEEVLNYPDTDTVTVHGITLPAKLVPLFLQATYDLVAQKHQQIELEKAIDKKIVEVTDSQGV